MLVTMHTTSPAIMSLEQSKNCVEEDNDGDVLKQESQDLAGLLSSPDAKNRDNGTPNIKSELNPGSNTDIKEEIKDEISIKAEPANPGSVGKLPNGDVNPDLDKKVGTPGDPKPPDKGKQESNGNPNTPLMGDVQIHSPANMGQMHRGSMVMSPGSAGMGPHMGAQGGPPMGPGPCSGPSPGMPVNQSVMMGPGGPMGPGPNGPIGPGPNGGPVQQQVPSDGSLIQQQSEIFVFTTQLANEAAQAVQNGQYKNILSYHMDQPNTKSFLQKNPKLRSGTGMYNMRNKMNMMNNPMGPMGGMPTGPGPMGYGPGPNSSNSVAQWVQQQNQNLQEAGLGMNDGDPRMMMGPNNPNFSQMMMDERMFDPDFGANQMNNMNLMQSKVPDENLTPEQLQRREEHLASIRKLQQMLFPEQRSQQGFHPGQGPGGQGMMPGDMGGNMSMYQQNMMATKRAMMSQQGMMGSPHGMMDSRQEMMSQEQFMMSQGMSQFGPGPHPQNMHNLSPAQREWMRLQQEYVTEKRAHHQQPRPPMGPSGPQMGPNGPPMGPGQPPPSYYSSIAQKQRHGSVGMGSPTSPNMNGPMDSPSMAVSGPEHTDPLAFPGHQRKGSFSGIDPMGGPMGPGMGPVMDPMMQQGSPMNHNMAGHMGNMPPSHGMKNSQVSLQRAGNPEQFVPEIPPGGQVSGSNASANKPPPSYAQSQSTKRKRDDMEELCKNLQPTPSPQHISYLNQFDGQELTITKQINTAYRDTNTSESQTSHYTQNNQMVNSPLHAPGSNKGPMSNSSQTSSGPLASPGPVSVTQGSGQGPGPSPMSGANMRLSHYDPQQQQQPQNSSSISNSPTTPTGKSSLSNITSASLANLAKGVENLSNQMQQHMMQGGPFHSIQMQSQQQQQVALGTQRQGTPQPQPQPQPQPSISNQPPQSVVPNSSQTSHSTPSVNNTYVNANLSIQQVNIQSVNHGGGGNNYSNSSSAAASMQVQQMNMEQTQMNMQQSGANMGGSSMTQTGSMSQSNATQSTNKTPSSGMPSGGVPSSAKTHSGNMNLKDSSYGGMGPPPGMHNNRSPFAQSQNPPQVPTSGRPGSPGFPPSSMANANVQIQQKAPNTIQYLPANQSPMLPETKPTGKPDLDFMAPFMSPTGSMDGKVPTSKMQYFPGPAGSPYGPGSMGPGSGSMGPGPGSMGSGPGSMGSGPGSMGPGPGSMGPGSMGPGPGSMGPGPGSMGPGPGSMGPGPGSMGPGPGSMGPGSGSMGPGPGSMGPGPGSMGPGPGSMGPGSMGPGPGSMGPGPGSMGPGPGSMGPGPGSMGPGPSSMGPGPGSMGPVPGSMGPGPGQAPGVPGGDGRMGPSMSIGQDPRFGGQSMSDLRMDPRMGPMAGDPRMGPLGPGADPRMSRHDARMGPGPDMVMSGDPRLVSAGMSPMSDPRMGPTANSMMGMGPGPGPMGSMRPGSRGSPFTGPIGPAVQQSMMMRRGSPDLPLGGGNFSPDPMNPSMTSMSGPMSTLSSLSGNPMTSMSNMSNSIMNDPMGPMGGGPTGSMGPNMPYNSPPYSGPMGSPIMMHTGPGAMSMQGPRMQGPMPGMSRSVSYSRQPSPGMRMSVPGMGPGPLSPGAPGYSSAQYQQFQQQLYSQGRPRQMSPLESMMGNPGGPGYGPMGPGMGAGMMPNMHGTM